MSLKFIQTHEASRDCTAPYDVVLDKPYTITEFIHEVLTTRPNEWGQFNIRQKGSNWLDRMAVVEYRYGKMENRDWEKIVASLPIEEVKARGGWSAMDYDLIIKE
ncbi:MAG: hypothetical protein K2J82_07680 [Muribaculaceae bacterium]|nr:hypothetical protein [Muribaculaceae bacterium]